MEKMKELKEYYEKKYRVKVPECDLPTPELVGKHIERYRLSSASAEIALLTTPELVEKYIERYRLDSDSAEIALLTTPELVEKYIEKYKLCSDSAAYIFSTVKGK